MRIAGIILLVFGALVTCLLFIGLFAASQKSSLAENIAIIFVFGNIPLIAGALLIRFSRVKKRQEGLEKAERTLLRMAHKYGGMLTTTIVAMETDMTLDEARHLLDVMVTKRAADTEVDDNGTVIYRFRGLAAK